MMTTTATVENLKRVIDQYWGYRSFRPLQEPAMRAMLAGRDALVVMPTGGGKSLCYQAPALLLDGPTVVVSPLISLMKDQVDGLRELGIAAAQIDSGQSAAQRRAVEGDLRNGTLRLLFVSPERLVNPGFQDMLRQAGVRRFAIDEAHCISHWGHDFRPEFRQLDGLKELFPGAAVYAFTATATEPVRRDIVERLNLQNPEILVGDFDRPNLTYRILPRRDLLTQVQDVLERHKDEAGIIYCIRRADVDDLTATLKTAGRAALAYHAGLTAEQRHAAQEAFAAEECNLIVATVAFGMGIDRSNIRYVLHTGMPKSIEHYQQETGRAGRDGLEAECVLLYSGADTMTWKSIITKSGGEPGVDPGYVANALGHLEDMDRYCRGAVCRHKALVNYFDQQYAAADCGACDLCLGDTELVTDALTIAQKILSCVARVQENFGVMYVIEVLRGQDTERIRRFGHNKLSTWGLLESHDPAELRDWIHQLIGQGLLVQTMKAVGERSFPILQLNAASWELMQGRRPVRLVAPKRAPARKAKADTVSWEGVDRGLFEQLRHLRKNLAAQRGVPPYVVMHDATLRDLARRRPATPAVLRTVYGFGEARVTALADQVLPVIREYCRDQGVAPDQAGAAPLVPPPGGARPGAGKGSGGSLTKARALARFAQGASVGQVMEETGRAHSTITGYLAEYLAAEAVADISPWVDAKTYQRVVEAAEHTGGGRLGPVFEALGKTVPYDVIRLVLAHYRRTPE